MSRHSIAKLLLRARYSRFGQLANVWIKAHMGKLWLPLRDLAITGHEPARDEFASPSFLDKMNYKIVIRRGFPEGNRGKWVDGFAARLRKRQ